MKTTTSVFWRNYSIFVSPFDGIFHAIAHPTPGTVPVSISPSGKLQQVAVTPERAIAKLQRDILWAECFESEAPAAIVQLAPFRLVYANEATGGKKLEDRRSLTESWSEAERDRYLLALFRDGVWEGHGVNSERVVLIDGSFFCLEKAQLNHQ